MDNNRQIKFRAFLDWGNLKLMIEDVDVFASGNIGVQHEQMTEALDAKCWKINDDYEFENTATGEIIDPSYIGCADTGEDYFIIHCELTLEQFTGLTDKEGKEIYEGDILMVGEQERKYEILFLLEDENGEKIAAFGMRDIDRGNQFAIDDYAVKFGKIIGTIHQ